MAFSFNFGGKTWWVARSISGYVTRAHEGDGEDAKASADYEAQDIDDMIFQQQPVSRALISSVHKAETTPTPWRILSIISKETGQIIFYLLEHRYGGVQWNIYETSEECEEYIENQINPRYGQGLKI
jgi:hypothetical protein